MAIIMENLDEIKYKEALKRVKRIKGFYTHLIVFIVINSIIVYTNIQLLNSSEHYFQMKVFSTPLCWGIGLVAHGVSVFLPTIIFRKDWEEKKIKELMEKEKHNKWE